MPDVSLTQGHESSEKQDVKSAPDPSQPSQEQSNFKKVQTKLETTLEEKKALQAKLDAILQAQKQAEEVELRKKEEYKTLLDQKTHELEAIQSELLKAKARADAYEQLQEDELQKLLAEIPEDKRPPLDQGDSVTKRLTQVRYAHSLLTPATPISTGVVKTKATNASRLEELMKKPNKSREEIFEMMKLSGK